MKIIDNPALPISEPGVYSGISLDRYHSRGICAGPSVSSSLLRVAWKWGMRTFWDQWQWNPNSVPVPSTRYMMLGSAAHHLLLGEDDFSRHFIGRPETVVDKGVVHPWNGNRIACKKWLEDQAAAGRTVLTAAELLAIEAMTRSMYEHPYAVDALRGLVEHSMIVRDEETGIYIRVRPDAIPTDSGDYVDLKLTQSVEVNDLKSSLRSFAYHQQSALVWEVAEKLGLPIESFTYIFIEYNRPYSVSVVKLDDEELSLGRRQNREMLRRIAECQSAGYWPGPNDGGVIMISLPRYERASIEHRLEVAERVRAGTISNPAQAIADGPNL